MSNDIENEYWATREGDEFVTALHDRIDEYYDYMQRMGIFWLIDRSYRAYYGGDIGQKGTGLFDSAALKTTGKSNQITKFKSNHFRNLIKHTLQLATSQKPAFACRATNSDYKSQAQTILGNGLVDYYLREKKLGRVINAAVERGLVFSEGWVHASWDPSIGEIFDVDPETQKPIHEGDLAFTVHTPLDVVRNTELEDDNHDWLILRDYRNKWDLIAQYPSFAEEIKTSAKQNYENYQAYSFNDKNNKKKSQQIAVFVFYHKPTQAMPHGRVVEVCGDVILVDTAMPYRKIPLYCLKPDTLLDTPFGYTPAFELLGPQQALDALSSAIMTNNAVNAVQNFWSRKGDDLSIRNLSEGMKHIQSEEKPEALQLTQSAPETFTFRQAIISEMETLSGISSTVRGNPEASLKSGNALALVVSQSIQFASLLEASYNELLEDLGTAIIDNLRDFSQTPRVAMILGESSRPFQKTFNGDDIAQINRVVVEQASALSKTVSGRVEIANQLMSNGMIETPKQYIAVLTTGQLDPLIEGTQHALLNIRAENEDMRNGKPPMPLVTENHEDHVREHRSIIENPEAKSDPQFVQMVLNHIQEHIDLWRGADPAILMITKQNPPPMPPMMGPPQGPGGPPPQGGVNPKVQAPPDKTGPQPNQPNMPQLPPNAPPEAQAALDNHPQEIAQ